MKQSRLAALLRDHPVVITGLGCCSSAGCTVDQLWAAAARGRSTARNTQTLTAGLPLEHGACAVADLERDGLNLQPVRRRDRVVQLAWGAALRALEQAGFGINDCPRETGVIAGSSRGPLSKVGESFARLATPKYAPSLAADATFAVVSGALTQALGVCGPASTVSATCASAGFAIAHAAEQIVLGRTGIMLAGGADATLHPAVIAQLAAAGVLGSHEQPELVCRPFDLSRNGLVPGEGSAFLVLESLDHAGRRGARPLARLVGWGLCVDESGRAGVTDSGRGLVEAMELALGAAGIGATEIDHLNAHGTGTRINDPAEARAIREVFGDQANLLPVTSTKPVTGHCLGATPALEAVLCVEALQRQVVPPTAGCSEVDPDCPIQVVTGAARPVPLCRVMSNSLGFWGCHASLIFAK